MIHDAIDTILRTDWLPKDGVARLVAGAVLGSLLTALLTAFRERGTRALARRANVADRFLTTLIETLETRLEANRQDVSTDARLVISAKMLRAEVRSKWRPTRKVIQLIDRLEQRVRFEQPAPSMDAIATESAELMAAWVQHPRTTRFSHLRS